MSHTCFQITLEFFFVFADEQVEKCIHYITGKTAQFKLETSKSRVPGCRQPRPIPTPVALSLPTASRVETSRVFRAGGLVFTACCYTYRLPIFFSDATASRGPISQQVWVFGEATQPQSKILFPEKSSTVILLCWRVLFSRFTESRVFALFLKRL